MAATRSERTLAFGDTHCPFHKKKLIEWLCREIRRVKPDNIVCLGDLFEAAAASVHGNEYEHDLVKEYADGGELLRSVRLAGSRRARLVWLLGNHDDNLQAADARRIPKELRRSAHWNESSYASEFERWDQYPYEWSFRAVFRTGQVMYWHGWNGDPDSQCLKLNSMMGFPTWTLTVHGHSHIPCGPTRVMKTKKQALPWYRANAGTLGPVAPEWANRQDTSAWGPGALVVESRCGSLFQKGKNWSCELLTP